MAGIDKDEVVRVTLDEISKGSNGACAADATGLCIASIGTLDKDAAAIGTQLISLAMALDPKQTTPPVVHLQSDTEKMIFSRSDDITVGLHYKN